MRYYFDIVLDAKRVNDPEGQEFNNLAEALAEASNVAVDIATGELRRGHRLRATWHVDVRDGRRRSVERVLFFEAILEPTGDLYSERVFQRHFLGLQPAPSVFTRSNESHAESREIVANVHQVFRAMRRQIDEIS